ncbi:hypothetical protein HF086_017189 [Spodoptera exigua]|uniref:ABC transmembrane type-2 domain-containing protein n=1 Tax=Spodoptera exigua TaxID=7107 RepID=A0A922MEE6_SPOEX|nr:hypothetical protein HF086_017189 [Spodoptera exigua]
MPAYDNEGATISMEDVRPPEQPITISTIEEELIARRHKMFKTQKSTVASRKQQAVCVRRAHKRYGTQKNPNIILDGLNMTVPKGAIYGLLGASGCGKTTLLSCIVGRRRLNSGEIWVLGGKPGSPGSGVPGPRIGYMPQEIALFGEFSIRETLIYFGWIANMPTKDVEERIDFLIQLLQLPNPTSIWDHLVDITKGGRTTVIITTHYIDETKQADIIGLMRGGRFLAEESPTELIRRYQGESLEDVFLKLSVLQNLGKRRRSSILADVVERVELPAIPNPAAVDLEEAEIGEISGEFGDNVSMSSKGRVVVTPELIAPIEAMPPEEKPRRSMEMYMPMKWHHMKALIWKNFLSLFRNFGALAFLLGLPVSQMIFFCVAIGHYPVGLPIAVVNYEVNSTDALCDYNKNVCPQDPNTYEWNLTRFSCEYLDFLSKRQSNLILYPTKEIAMNEARHDKQVEWMLSRDIQLAFMEATEHLAKICDLPARIMSIPVTFNKPIYGLEVPNLTDFAGPGVILTIVFFLAVALTSGSMLAERNEGILERSLVSGITGTEILFSHVLVQMLIMMLQSGMVMLLGFLVFGLTIKGPVGWVICLTVMTGLCGMTFGFVVSTICDTDRTATYLALGSFLPMVMLCGIIWPIEGMHVILQWVSYFLPLTLSTEGLRSMLQRGWSVNSPTVYAGFISVTTWIAVYLSTSILLLKFKKG